MIIHNLFPLFYLIPSIQGSQSRREVNKDANYQTSADVGARRQQTGSERKLRHSFGKIGAKRLATFGKTQRITWNRNFTFLHEVYQTLIWIIYREHNLSCVVVHNSITQENNFFYAIVALSIC